MREILIWCVVLLAAFSSAQASVIYRKYRQLEIPVVEIQPQDAVQDVVAELRKEVIPVEVDIIEPMAVLEEEVAVPVHSVKGIELSTETEQSVPVLNEILPKNIRDELPSENELVENEKEETPGDESVTRNEVNEGEGNLNDENFLPAVKQNANTTLRPTIFQQAQQSFGQFIDTIRRPLTTPRAPNGTVETSSNPNLLQQLQTSVQNFGSQLTNALLPNQNLGGSSTPRPPNIFENLQTNFQQVVSSVFRPPTETAAAPNPTPVGPLQAVISNVQSFFTGNRGGETTTQSNKPTEIEEPNKPVDNKIGAVKNSEEIKGSSEDSEQMIIVGEPDNSSE